MAAPPFFDQRFKGVDCEGLAARIADLERELATRARELRADVLKLPPRALAPRDSTTIEGHIEKMAMKQREMRRALSEAEARGCGPPPGSSAWKWATGIEGEGDVAIARERVRARLDAAAGSPASGDALRAVLSGLGIAAAAAAAVLAAPEVAALGVAAALLSLTTASPETQTCADLKFSAWGCNTLFIQASVMLGVTDARGEANMGGKFVTVRNLSRFPFTFTLAGEGPRVVGPKETLTFAPVAGVLQAGGTGLVTATWVKT